MALKYCRIAGGNFGDDLNTLIWPGLFPDMAKLNGRALFYGVGTLLDGRHDKSMKKVVLGSGIGEAHAALSDPNWDFRWVRGPSSAREFNLSKKFALGDPALLWRELQVSASGQGAVGLIPHYATWDSYDWVSVASNAGMVAINPRQSPTDVTAQMRRCSRILSESLHGAICADAMGIPWSVCVLAHRFNDFKWKDWLDTVQRPFAPLVMDRPLVRTIRPSKAWVNRLARWTNYRRGTSYPALRAVAAATLDDARHVSETLYRYSKDEAKFRCSKPADVARQKDRMMTACADFAKDYDLRFTP